MSSPTGRVDARDQIACVLEEHRQDLERLFLQAQSDATFAQFARARIEVEYTTSRDAAERVRWGHRSYTRKAPGSSAFVAGLVIVGTCPNASTKRALATKHAARQPRKRARARPMPT